MKYQVYLRARNSIRYLLIIIMVAIPIYISHTLNISPTTIEAKIDKLNINSTVKPKKENKIKTQFEKHNLTKDY